MSRFWKFYISCTYLSLQWFISKAGSLLGNDFGGPAVCRKIHKPDAVVEIYVGATTYTYFRIYIYTGVLVPFSLTVKLTLSPSTSVDGEPWVSIGGG